MEKLFEYYRKLVRETDIEFYRYIYSKINWNSRMIGLTGPDRKSTRLNSSHPNPSRMPSSA